MHFAFLLARVYINVCCTLTTVHSIHEVVTGTMQSKVRPTAPTFL